MRGNGPAPTGPRGRGGRTSSGGGHAASSILVLLSCLGTLYVGGRLWQDARLQSELLERQPTQPQSHSKALSVDESIMKIEFAELQKREALLQVLLAEAKSRGFVSMAALSPNVSSAPAMSVAAAAMNSPSTASLAPGAVQRKRGHYSGGRLLAVVGINTRFANRPLRDALRNTWVPNGGPALRKLQEEVGIVIRFVVGRSPNKGDSSDKAIDDESAQTQDFMIMEDHEEDDHDMARKLKSFYANAVQTWDADFYIKMDDDVYVNIMQLVSLLEDQLIKPRVYMGCMKSGDVVADTNSRWFEPEWYKFGDGKQYFRHAAGPFHIVSKEVALFLAINRALLHEYKHEDVSLGSWMIGLEVMFDDNKRLCCASAPDDECAKRKEAGKACVAVYDWHCSGLCEAEKRMAEVHRHCA